MGQISLNLPQVGGTNAAQEPLIPGDFSTIQGAINGGLDATNITAGLAQSAIINQSGQTVKGSSIVATSQNTGSTTFTTLTTPDQVTGIVLPSPGLIQVWYEATWQNSVASAGAAAIFFNSNQVVAATSGSAAPVAQSATCTSGTAVNVPLASFSAGLLGGGGGTNYTGDATTGQIIGIAGSGGGPVSVFAAAGTYTVSVQFKASSGTVTASNRRLYVQALSFA